MMATTPIWKQGVGGRFLGGRPPPTLGRTFWEEEDDNEDDGEEQGRRARRRRRYAVNVRDTLRGRAVTVVVHGLPKATIISDDRGEGKRGGSFADEMITDEAKTTATMERGIRQ